jgi:soluble lytic murein transglycosylase-like protein
MAAYAQYQDTPGPAVQVIEQSRKQQEHVATNSRKIKKHRSARHFKSRNYSRQVHSAGTRHNIDPRLIHAVIEVESSGDPNAVSPRGAKGLMQITPGICKRYGVSNPFDIEQNINAGSAYLAHLLEALNGDLERALAAYNCGLGRVSLYKEIPPPSETRIFVDKIISKYRSKILNGLISDGHSG